MFNQFVVGTKYPVLIVPLWNWNREALADKKGPNRSNRTFMELKYFNRTLKILRFNVLIVPLWNWNKRSRKASVFHGSSNRTFMELKLHLSSSLPRLVSRSNRTFMELKYRWISVGNNGSQVLIVPLWNWNYIQH